MASSGKTARSSPWSSASASAATTRATLPSRSPTVVLIWHKRGTERATRQATASPAMAQFLPRDVCVTPAAAGIAGARSGGRPSRWTSPARPPWPTSPTWSSAARPAGRAHRARRLGAAAVERVVASPSWPRRSLRSAASHPVPAADRRRPAALDVLASLDSTGAGARVRPAPAATALTAPVPRGSGRAAGAGRDQRRGRRRRRRPAGRRQAPGPAADHGARSARPGHARADDRGAGRPGGRGAGRGGPRRERAPRAWPSSAWASWAAMLNYASDVDVMFVDGDARQARAVMDLARRCFRVDANLRPEGRDGALTRSVESYRSYWQRWARPWEFQALLKAVPVAGDPQVGRAWADAASAALWAGASPPTTCAVAAGLVARRGRGGAVGSRRARGQAGPGRHPRHRVRGADAAARARRRPRAALAQHAHRPGRDGRGRLRRPTTPPTWRRRTASCAGSSTRCRSRTSARRTPCPPS